MTASAVRLGLGNILTTEEYLRTVWQMIQETAFHYDLQVGRS
jgi:hypothetical protein